MKVLLVAYYFPPIGGGGVNRTLLVARAMAAAGWEPWVLTVDDAAWTHDPALLDRVPARARVVRIPNLDWGRVARWRDGRPGFRRARAASGPGAGGRLRHWLVPDLCVGWSALAVPVAGLLACSAGLDCVYTTCPPYSVNAVGLLAQRLGLPWVADFRDAWVDYPARERLPAWRRRLERRMEGRVFGAADHVLFASEGARAGALRRAPGLAARSQTVLTGFDPEEFAVAGEDAAPPGRLEVVHAGNVGVVQHAALDRFAAALHAWAARDARVRERVRVRFVGAEPGVAVRLAKAGVADLVRVEPAVPRASLPARLRRAHVCLVFGSESATGGETIPGKVFDAAGADRPLLAVTQAGGLARLVRERRLGSAVHPDDAEGIAAALGAHLERSLRGQPPARPASVGRATLAAPPATARILAAIEGVACPSA